jgi:hypothetical protein
VRGFDYTTLHWADKQKPLQEVAGEFGVFPEGDFESPALVPEEIDEEASVEISITEVTVDAEGSTLIERVTVEEHVLRVEYAPARSPERKAGPDENVAA